MHECPCCKKECLPSWRALLRIPFLAGFACPNCRATIQRRRRVQDLIIAVPMAIAWYALPNHGANQAMVWCSLALAFILGILIYLPFAVFDETPGNATKATQ